MRILLTAIAALAFTGAASAAGINDLTQAGYTVGVAGSYVAGCTTYSVIGHAMSNYITLCTDPAQQTTVDPNAQSEIASWTNPGTIYESDWQSNHPDQVTAATKISSTLCYSITRSAPLTDSWLIVGGGTNLTSSGAGLVPLAQSLPNVCAQNLTPVVSIVPGTDGVTVTNPGASSTVAAITQQAAAQNTPPPTTTTTTTTTTTAAAGDVQPLALVQTVSVALHPNSGTTIASALSKSVGATVVLNANTKFIVHGIRLTAAKFKIAFKSHHRAKITGTHTGGKLIAASVTLI